MRREVSHDFTFARGFSLTRWQLVDGTAVTIRPIRCEDEPLMYEFHQSLSAQSIRLRYFGLPSVESRVGNEHLPPACSSDDNGEVTVVAERIGFDRARHQIISVAHLRKVPQANEAELAIVILDEWQGKGLGTKILYELLEIGRTEDLERLFGYVLFENYAMRHICGKLGFAMRYSVPADAIEAEITL